MQILSKLQTFVRTHKNIVFAIIGGLILLMLILSLYFANNSSQPITFTKTLKEAPIKQAPIKEEPKPKDQLQELKNFVEQPQLSRPTQQELETAAKILDFTNQAAQSCNEGWYAQADLIAFFCKIYAGEWQLAVLPQAKVSKETSQAQLTPPPELFAAETTTYIVKTLNTMTQNLEEMLVCYQDLSRYVADTSIQDEGARGKIILQKIQENYTAFNRT